LNRVLIAGHIGLPFGGIATYCETLLNSSLPRSAEISFVETSRGGHDVSTRGGWGLRDGISAIQNILNFLFVFMRVRPRVVHIMTAQMPSMLKHGLMLILARSLGAKVVLQIHCSVSAMFPTEGGSLNRFSEYVVRQAQGILVLSQEWMDLNGRFGNTQMRYLPNGINLVPYLAISRPAPKTESDPVKILYLGHLGSPKGTLDLIEAANILNKEKFIIELVGEPFNSNAMTSIIEQVDRYNLRQIIRIFPPEFGEAKLARFASADIFVLPSLSEGMPISIIESMAAGLPVIATMVGGIPEMVENEKTGLLVPPGNPDKLADAIKKLIISEETRMQMGRMAREIAQSKYDIELIIPGLLEFYRFAENAV
jgi:glycosyltransferase involved in cell wall biosynthesis